MESRCRYCLNQNCILLNLAKRDFSFHPEEFTRLIAYEKGQTLFQEGNAAHGYYLICSGRIKLARRSPSGKRTLLEILGPGDIVGLAKNGRYRLYAEALETSKVGYIEQKDFGHLVARHPHLATALIEKLTDELARLQERLYTTTQSGARTKLAYLLLELAADFGRETPEGTIIDLRLSQAQLAEMTGLTRETVSSMLNAFVEKGWIKSQGRKIVILLPLSLECSL
jgi:CRP-like cAMP-binding protein